MSSLSSIVIIIVIVIAVIVIAVVVIVARVVSTNIRDIDHKYSLAVVVDGNAVLLL